MKRLMVAAVFLFACDDSGGGSPDARPADGPAGADARVFDAPTGGADARTYDAPTGGPDARVFDAPTGAPDATPTTPDAMRVTWNANIQSLVMSCTMGGGCHGGGSPAGGYSLASYTGALGNGTDSTPNVIPGSASSLLITHGHAAGISPQLRVWIVDNNAAEY